MQTLSELQTRTSTAFNIRRIARICVILSVNTGILLLSACSSPLSVKELNISISQTQVEPSACDQAWTHAQHVESRMKDPFFNKSAGSRLLDPVTANTAWQQVASNCPARFEEAIVRSALALHRANTTQRSTQQPEEMVAETIPNLTSSTTIMNNTELTTAAKIEDEAGFAYTVLAGRNSQQSSLLLSNADKHHAMAQVFASALTTPDPREGIYSVKELLNNPQTTLDPANKLLAPTPSVVEINCARHLLTVTRSVVDAHRVNGTTPQSRQETESKTGRETLIRLTTAHFYTALELGYPSYDQALFTPQS